MSDYSTPPGWYPDGDGWERWWDGSAWAAERRRTSPAAPPPPPTGAQPAPGPTGAEATQLRPGGPGASGGYGAPGAPGGYQPPASGGSGYGQIPSAPAGFPGAASGGFSGGAPSGPPPGGAHPSSSYGPPGGGYGAPPRKSKLWLWLTLAAVLVLVVGVGVTLAVVQPWSGDDTTADGGDDGDGGDGDGSADDGIHGDLDGDGKGDMLAAFTYDYDDVKLVKGISTGESFETTELAGDPYSAAATVYLDWDGDGADEDLIYSYSESGELGLRSSDGEFPDTAPIDLPFSSLAEYYDATAVVIPGDYDGDGNADLAVQGPADRKVDVYVMLGAGDGTFAEPTRWASIPNTLVDETTLIPGDYDGDGDDDFFAELPAEQLKTKDFKKDYFFGDEGTAAITSTGDSFDVGPVTEDDSYVSQYLSADLGGEKDLVLSLTGDSYDETLTVVASEFLDGRLLPAGGYTLSDDIGDRDLAGAGLSDVDGDGDDDIVYLAKKYDAKQFSDLTVIITEEDGFTAGTSWGSVPACPDDYCSVRFY